MVVTEVQKFLEQRRRRWFEEIKADQVEPWKSGGMNPFEVIIEEAKAEHTVRNLHVCRTRQLVRFLMAFR